MKRLRQTSYQPYGYYSDRDRALAAGAKSWPNLQWQQWRWLRCQPQPLSLNAGLTLVETMVSLVVMTTLLSVVLQLIVSAAWMAMQAEKYNQAMHWIQADVEAVKFRAREFDKNAFPNSPSCSASGGVALAVLTDINTNTPEPKNLVAAPTQMQLGPNVLGGENLVMTRLVTLTNPPNSNPDKLLQLTYTVNKADASNNPVGDAIASFTTEVVPYAALKCP